MSGFHVFLLIVILAAMVMLTTLLGTTHFARSLPAKALIVVELCIALIPAPWIALFVAIVMRARLELGFWPYPQHSEPGAPFPGIVSSPLDPSEFGLHCMAVWLLAPAVIFSGVAYGPVWAALRTRAGRSGRIHTRIYAAGFALCWCLWILDPGQFVAWFVD